ncbi:MAG: hypothetical protein ACO1OB_06860, partial [Archangium sp.]
MPWYLAAHFMPQRRALLALLLMGLFAGGARAEDAYVPPTFSVQLLGGASGRSTQLQPSADLAHVRGSSITGVAPFYFRVDASVFFLRWLGLEADGLGDVFVARSGNTRVSSQRFAARGGLALRWASAGGFTLSGSLGYGVWLAPVIIHPTFNELDAKGRLLESHGPVARLGVGLEKGRFDGSLSAILQVPLGATTVRVLTLEPRLWLGARVWDPSPTTALYLGADVGALVERGGICDGFT